MSERENNKDRRRFLIAAGTGAVGATVAAGCGQAAEQSSPEEPGAEGPAAALEPTRVVTGHDEQGKSVFEMQGPPSRAVSFDSAGGVELVELWATDETPEVPRENGDPVLEMASFTPGLNGSRFRLVKFPPATEGAELDAQAVLQEVEEKAPGEWNFEEDAPGMHTTDTVDYGVVISGEISLVLDDGAALSLKQGDCVVQNGTRHAWNNTGSEPCWMAFVMIGAQRRS